MQAPDAVSNSRYNRTEPEAALKEIHHMHALELAQMIRERKISSSEALQHYIARIDKYNDQVNAVICMDLDAAVLEARRADEEAVAGRFRGLLHGVPMTMKESFNVTGMPTTWGLPKHRGWRPSSDGYAARCFKKAGAIIFGKTNVPTGLTDLDTFNEIYGVTNNPYDLSCIPGGSSGGSAAALAAGLTALEVGSDSGSSIRYPAHYCGVYGHKPTWGIVSKWNEAIEPVHGRTDISASGPMARHAGDLALSMGLYAGADEIDSRGWSISLQCSDTPVRKRKVAVMISHELAEVSSEIKSCMEGLVDFLRRHGMFVNTEARPDINFEEAHETFVRLLAAARGLRVSDDEFAQAQGHAQEEVDLHDYGSQRARGLTISHRDWLVLDEKRHRIRLKWMKLFSEYDYLICPVALTSAFPHIFEGAWYQRQIKIDGRTRNLSEQIFWAGFASMCYLPATAAPIGFSAAGLPIGVQIIGPQYGDLDCIELAEFMESEFYSYRPPAAFG